MDVIETAADIAGTATSVVTRATSILGWVPWAIAAASILGGTGGTVWYRMKWLDEVAAGAKAVAEQIEVDKRDNARSMGILTNQLNTHQRELEYAQSLLSNIPRSNACERDQRINAARDILCRKYPQSQTCSGPRPAR